MPNLYFKFKQFTVFHDRCAMKVGTDGVLLGAWATHDNPKRILDIGTGSGLVALMLAQRYEKAKITGIEIDSEAALQAKENVEGSIFADRVDIENVRLQDYLPSDSFDLIVCNPPFFPVTSISESEVRNTARQIGMLQRREIIQFAASHLTEGGILAMIYPYDNSLQEEALAEDLRVNRKLMIKGNAGADAKRIIWEFSRLANPNLKVETLILEESRNQYTTEAKELLNNFYLYL